MHLQCDKMIGQTIAHYQIQEVLGEGGMGVVYKAQDVNLDRPVAIKFLQPHRRSDEQERLRFIQEAKAASSLDHPNICTIYEIDTAPNGQLFIAMAYYAGETLRRKLARGPLSIDDALKYTVDIAQGLAKAHANGLVHRDIKPDNIIITIDGVAKILDFGLVKLSFDSHDGSGDSVLGTIEYMAPEQIYGQADRRSDLWSLGVVLYEMVSDRRPFTGKRPSDVFHAISNDAYTPLSELCEGVPAEVQRFVARALAKSPADRYQRAEEMLAHLHALRHGITSSPTIAVLPGDRHALSIAVLPFTNMTRDDETEYFGDGLTDELIHLLSQVRGLHVVSHTSVFEFKGKSENIRSIAERLNVSKVLEGSVRRSGNTLRITAQLTDAIKGYHLWSERYDRELKDVFAIQEDIALSIASTLKLKLKSEIAPVKSRYSGSVEAHALYLKGRFHWEQRTEEGLRKAGQCFQQAITLDPNCAPAFAGLADYFISLGFWGLILPREAWDRGRELAFRAMQIDDHLAEAEISLAKCALFNHWDWRQAEDRFLRAIELNPALPAGHFWYAILLIQLGRFDSSLLELRCAHELDPLSLTVATGLAWAQYYLGKYDRAAAECQKVFDLQPDYFEALACMGLIIIQEKRPADAILWFERALTSSGNSALGLGFLGYALAQDSRTESANENLAQLMKASAARYISPTAMALIHIGLSDYDRAMDWLENAYDVRDAWLAYAKVFPPYEPLRGSARFRALLARIALGGDFDQQTT